MEEKIIEERLHEYIDPIVILGMIKKYPNDQELGKRIRQYCKESKDELIQNMTIEK